MSRHNEFRDAVCDSGNLAKAYARYRRYRGLWARGLPMGEVAAEPVAPMLALAEELRRGEYRPQPPAPLAIAKANGELRHLQVYMIRDRVAQRALLQVLAARTEPHMAPCSYGFRPGRGVAGAVARVQDFLDTGYRWVVDADIEHCFDSIPRDPLLDQVARRAGREAALRVAEALGWEAPEQREELGIPQGAVLSPWLCNIYLWQLDDAMAERKAPMVRFADDFVVLAASGHRAEDFRAGCAAVLGRLRLKLHPLKTAIVEASHPFRFLGQWLSATRRPACPPLPI